MPVTKDANVGIELDSVSLGFLNHPVRSFKGGFASLFLMSRPPLLEKEGNPPGRNRSATAPSAVDSFAATIRNSSLDGGHIHFTVMPETGGYRENSLEYLLDLSPLRNQW